jgi:polyferredoxin
VLVLISAALVMAISLRSPFRVDVVRDRGALARLVEDGRIENGYSLQLMNASEQAQSYRVTVSGLPGAQIIGRADVDVGPANARWLPLAVQIPPESAAKIGPGAHTISFAIERRSLDASPSATVTEKSTFVIPR